MDGVNSFKRGYHGPNADGIISTMTRAAQPDGLKQIGARLAAVRALLGLTQDQAAEIAGITKSAWSMWEVGDRTPAPASMLKFKERYGIPLDWIYAGDPARLPHDLASKLL